MKFIFPWSLYLNQNKWVQEMRDLWGSNCNRTFAQLSEHAGMEQLSAKIRDMKINKVSEAEKRYKAVVFLHPCANGIWILILKMA